MLARIRAVEGILLTEVPPVVDGGHAGWLRLVVVGVHHDGLVLSKAGLGADAPEEGLGVAEAPVVEGALGDPGGHVAIAGGASHLLAKL